MTPRPGNREPANRGPGTRGLGTRGLGTRGLGWASTVPLEARAFQGHRAGIVTRVLANTIDLVIVTLLLGGLYLGWSGLRFVLSPTTFSFPRVSFGLVLVVGGALLWASFAIAWATTGRTTGARILGIRVVNHKGQRLRWSGAAVRALFCVMFLPGLFWVIVSGENRSVQDLVLRTSVIYDWTKRPAAPGER